MALKVFCSCCTSTQPSQLSRCFVVKDFLVGTRLQVFAYPQAAGVLGILTRRQYMVRSDTLVTIRYTGSLAEEQRTIVLWKELVS